MPTRSSVWNCWVEIVFKIVQKSFLKISHLCVFYKMVYPSIRTDERSGLMSLVSIYCKYKKVSTFPEFLKSWADINSATTMEVVWLFATLLNENNQTNTVVGSDLSYSIVVSEYLAPKTLSYCEKSLLYM